MKAYQLKIQIKDSHPSIWRRCIVPSRLSFSQLSVVLNMVMGWAGYHLCSFEFPQQGIMLEDEPEDDFIGNYQVFDAAEHLIDSFLDSEKKFVYIYDFGDNWEHQVTVEKVLMTYPHDYPTVVKFKEDTPYEDCGGIWGYYDLLETLQNPEDPEYEHMTWWTEQHFHRPYQLDMVNKTLEGLALGTKESGPMTQSQIYEEIMNGQPFRRIQVKEEPECALPEEMDFDLDFLRELKRSAIEHEKNVNAAIVQSYQEKEKSFLLEDVLSCYRKEDLKEIAKIHKMKGYHKYNKADLLRFLIRELLSPDEICQYFFYINESEYAQLKKAGKDQRVLEKESYYLHVGGYACALPMGGCLIPDDVRTAYQQYCTGEWEKEREEKVTLLYHLNAVVELYGCFTLEQFLQIYEKNTGIALEEMELLHQIMQIPEGVTRFILDGKSLVLKEIKEREGQKELISCQRGKPYYTMTMTEIKTLGGEGYLPFDKTMEALCTFFVKELGEEEDSAGNVCREIQYHVRIGNSIDEILQTMEVSCILMEEEQMEQFADLLSKCSRHVRQIARRGHTEAEENSNSGTENKKKVRSSEKVVDFQSRKKKR